MISDKGHAIFFGHGTNMLLEHHEFSIIQATCTSIADTLFFTMLEYILVNVATA